MIVINVVNIYPIITGKHNPTMSGKHRPAIDSSSCWRSKRARRTFTVVTLALIAGEYQQSQDVKQAYSYEHGRKSPADGNQAG